MPLKALNDEPMHVYKAGTTTRHLTQRAADALPGKSNMLRVNLMVCRNCQQVFSLTDGIECPMCRSPLRMSVFVEEAAQKSVQRTACKHPEIKRLGGVLYCKVCGEQLD